MGTRMASIADQMWDRSRAILQWALLVFIIMPLSTIYDVFTSTRNKIVFSLGTAPRAHARKVMAIQKQMREWSASNHGTKVLPVHGWFDIFQPPPAKGITLINTGVLRDILEIDTYRLSVRVEPMVTMQQLAQALLPLGFSVPLFPGRPGLTVQDLINGGVDTSGRKYGLFQHICHSYELVMPDGDVVVATKEKNGDAETQALFYGLPWSAGSLGILVAVTLRLIPIKPYVKVTYMFTGSIEEMQDKLTEECSCRENEFVEGIQLSEDVGVVLRGRFSDGPPKNFSSDIARIGRWYQSWFYSHVAEVVSSNKERTEYVPLEDYYYRHNKSLFWELNDLLPIGNTLLHRWFFGWMSAPRQDIVKNVTPDFVGSEMRDNYVHEDILVPMDCLIDIIETCDSEAGIYPLWLCPYNQPSCPGMIRQRSGRNVLFVNVGVYGVAKTSSRHCIRRLEEAARDANGVKMLHNGTQMNRAEFWQMFDSSLYEWLRVKYNCKEAFLDVYDNVCQAVHC